MTSETLKIKGHKKIEPLSIEIATRIATPPQIRKTCKQNWYPCVLYVVKTANDRVQSPGPV